MFLENQIYQADVPFILFFVNKRPRYERDYIYSKTRI